MQKTNKQDAQGPRTAADLERKYRFGKALTEVRVVTGNAQNTANDASRAVARLNILLELTAPYVKVGGKVLAMKGAAAPEELEEAKNAIRKLGLAVERVAEFPVDDAIHRVIVLKKVAQNIWIVQYAERIFTICLFS